MKTIADKNKVETELRCTPSNIRCERKRAGKGMMTAKWIAVGMACIVAVWFVTGYVSAIINDPNVKMHHLLIAFVALRWLFVRRASTIRAIILIVIITAIFN
jgi:hypothetical protein